MDEASTTHPLTEQNYKVIDGKWVYENGDGKFFIYENNDWIVAEDEELAQKWMQTEFQVDSDPYHCVINGVNMEWNETFKQWLPLVEVNEDFLAQYHSQYGVHYDYEGNKSLSITKDPSAINEKEKGKKRNRLAEEKGQPQGWVELDESKNTSIYVSNLPYSVTEESFIELMSKCGVIQRDARTNKLKVKLYKEFDGSLKGDGTCVYIKKESVDLALSILDGWNLDGKQIKVEKARYEMKGEFDPNKKRKKLTAAQKKRYIENQQRIFEWRPEKPRNYRPISDCTIVMKHMFDFERVMKDASVLLDVEKETREFCERFGAVKKVVVHDNNPEGIVCVTFKDTESSDSAVRALNGHVVDSRKLEVFLWDGKTKYSIAETEEQRAARIEQWRKFISE